MILVDSSLLIEWLRKHLPPHRQIEPWIRSQQAFTCGVVRAEVLRGVVSPAQRRKIELFFDVQVEIPCNQGVWRDVVDLAWLLDRQGTVLPLTDLIIGVCARQVGATVITTDAHFSQIPGLQSSAELPPSLTVR